MSEEAFIRGLLENPEDDTLRLVYADWLEEHGDNRSEFLRAAIAVRTAANDPSRLALRQRVQELRSSVPTEWLVKVFRSLAEDEVREAVFRNLLGDNGWP